STLRLVESEVGGSLLRDVDIATFPVTFDAVRKLWFADIVIDAGGAYFPFVRLALARYQPHAVETTELSRVVVADAVTIAPERTVTVTRAAGDSNRFAVKVEGRTYQANAWKPSDNEDLVGPSLVGVGV